jgi:hypothetical protein
LVFPFSRFICLREFGFELQASVWERFVVWLDGIFHWNLQWKIWVFWVSFEDLANFTKGLLSLIFNKNIEKIGIENSIICERSSNLSLPRSLPKQSNEKIIRTFCIFCRSKEGKWRKIPFHWKFHEKLFSILPGFINYY